MHDYDVVLKLLLKEPARQLMRELTDSPISRWLNVEMPEVVHNTRVDLLGESADGELIHLELQSTNDPNMALRMAEYCLRIYRLFGKFPRQVVLYVGSGKLRMEPGLEGPALAFQYRILDIRNLDGDELLQSPDIGDTVIAVLGRLRDERAAVRQILRRIATLDPSSRNEAFSRLLILAGLRRLEEYIEEEGKNMPVLDSILDHKVIGREFKRARQAGLEEGRQEGRQEGRHEGELALLCKQMEKRFGQLPTWVGENLSSRSEEELEDLAVRLLDAATLEELLR